MSATMQAGVLHGAKDIRLEKVASPELRPGMVRLRVRRVGICGSDMHYFEHGYCAAFIPTRPFILGHELTADVAAVAADVKTLDVGARVTVNPARACGFCNYCKAGRGNLCRQTIMLGSASTTPPTDGAFAEFVTVRADQCHVLPSHMNDGLGAMMSTSKPIGPPPVTSTRLPATEPARLTACSATANGSIIAPSPSSNSGGRT